MNTNSASGAERIKLNFANLVKERFAFLNDLGFVEVESLPTFVLYRRGGIDVDVYHGRQSYEVGCGISRHGIRFSLPEVIRLMDQKCEEKFRYPIARTQESLAKGLTTIAELLERYCMQAIQGDPAFFSILENQRKIWREKYAFDVVVRQLRPKAHEAFRLGKYEEAAELYRRIEPSLTPSEIKKLAFSEKHRGGK